MATSMKEAFSFERLSLVVGAGIGFVLGLLLHSFIVAVNIMDWLKGRPVTANDQVIASIGISRFIFQSACLFHMFLAIFVNDSYINFLLIIMKVMSNYSNIWLTTLLSILFCLKVSNFQNVFFLKLKIFVSQNAVHFISGSVLVSIIYTVIHTWLDCTAVLTNSTQTFNGIFNMPKKTFTYFILGNTMPLLIYVTASLLVVFFLCLHMSKMKSCGNSSFSLDNYYSALKVVVYCLLCYTFHLGNNFIVLYYVDSLSIVWINVILNIFPALHSVILIYKTPKLKTQFLRLL